MHLRRRLRGVVYGTARAAARLGKKLHLKLRRTRGEPLAYSRNKLPKKNPVGRRGFLDTDRIPHAVSVGERRTTQPKPLVAARRRAPSPEPPVRAPQAPPQARPPRRGPPQHRYARRGTRQSSSAAGRRSPPRGRARGPAAPWRRASDRTCGVGIERVRGGPSLKGSRRRRRGRGGAAAATWIFRGWVAATPQVPSGDSAEKGRGAAGAPWRFRGDGSRCRHGRDVDRPWRRRRDHGSAGVAAIPTARRRRRFRPNKPPARRPHQRP